MEKKLKKTSGWRVLLIVAVISSIGFTTGCRTPRKLDATRSLILNNERGFRDAYDASPESKEFVQSLMRQIIDYEYELEKASLE